MLNLLLTGCCGRMGRFIADKAALSESFRVLAGVDINPSATRYDFPVFSDVSEAAASPLTSDIDVVIDFSHHTAVSSVLDYTVSHHKAAVIATTGHTDEEKEMIFAAARSVPVFYSFNMSLGINLLSALVRRAASLLDGFDIEIVEAHHRSKLDAPSGTALMLADAAEQGLDYKPEYVYERQSRHCARGDREIGIHSVRGGTIVGEHEVVFAGDNEVIRLSHSATSREVFARGALRAAEFIADKPAGLYSMQSIVDEAEV